MARRSRKDIKAQQQAVLEQKRERKKLATKKNLITAAELIGVTAGIFVLYRTLMETLSFEAFRVVLIVYMVIAAASTLFYVIYNRGMSRKGVTPDMLPDDWSEEQKREFIEDGKARLKRSRHLLIVIFAFFFTFVIDIIELVAIPMFKGWFS